ncbi:MAG: hypothetical protein IPI49_02165 [Myxococcales bacterium]|nr:hypothetical protein [Myxococcales bacterium]
MVHSRISRALGSHVLSPLLAVGMLIASLATQAQAQAGDVKTYDVTGEADAGASDPRAVAVDDAFAEATKDAVEDLLTRAQRTEHRATLSKEIIGRARRWVASYKVATDETAAGRRTLTVTVRINLQALRARLVELQILDGAAADSGDGAKPAGEPDDGPVAQPEPSASRNSRWSGRTATLLLRSKRGTRAAATFGAAAERSVPGASAATAVMAERGLVVKPAALVGPAPRRDGELPLADESARALATESRAELAVLVGAQLSDRQAVRGVATPMILARATARVVAAGKDDVEGEGQGTAVVAAGEDERTVASSALDRAVSAAVRDALPLATQAQPLPVLTADDEPLPVIEGGVWLRVHARTSWKVVSAVQRHLGKQAGTSAELRRLSPAGYLILVKSDRGIERVAAAARATVLPTGAGVLKVRNDRGVVTARVEEP